MIAAPARAGRGPVALLALPSILMLAATFLFPLAWLVRTALTPEAGSSGTFSIRPLAGVATDPFYWWVIGKTITLGLIVSVFAVPLAFPIAHFLVRTGSRWRNLLIGLAIAPLLTSTVIRTYGWMVILGRHGVISRLLIESGLIRQPLRIDNGLFGTVVALVEVMMPYAIVSMLGGLGGIDRDLEQAARMLGADRVKTFLRVTLPLSMPAILTAGLLVFVLSISSLVIPQLMGGGRVFVLAVEIFNETTLTLDWPLAASLSIFLMLLLALVIAVYRLIAGRLGGAA